MQENTMKKLGKAMHHIRKTRNPLLIESGQSEASQSAAKSRIRAREPGEEARRGSQGKPR